MKENKMNRRSLINIIIGLVIIIMFISFISWMTSSMLAKYKKEIGGSGIISSGDFDLSYQMRDPFLVDSLEELLEAIQYGYSYIRLTDPADINDTWVISGDETISLDQPLTIDLNGQTLIRNGRLSVLGIPEGATLTILDTSPQKSGGFYNPVGSVFSIEGGSMLVMGGKIESGPRYWEYYSYNDGTIIQSSRVNTSVMINGNNGTAYPFISYPNRDLGLNGNIYFDVAVGNIPADSYCYYICSDGSTSNDTTIDTSFADFSYSYYITNDDAHTYVASPTEGQDVLKVDIYGYQNNIANASSAKYSAVDMQSGALVVNTQPTQDYAALDTNEHALVSPKEMTTGCFISYFGVENTSCIYMQGGQMHVENAGIFTTVNPSLIPNATGLAKNARGTCIATSTTNNGELLIDNGVYRSYNNRTINVLSGDIQITGGNFDMLSNFTSAISGRSAIYISSNSTQGEDDSLCKIENAKFRIRSLATTQFDNSYGSYIGTNAVAVYVDGGTINMDNIDFNIHGSYMTGLYISDGNAELNAINMAFDGTNSSYGIYSAGGEVKLTDSNFSILGVNSRGIEMTEGSIVSTDVKYTLSGNNSAAITLNGGQLYINKSNEATNSADINMSGTNSTAIYSKGGDILSERISYRLTGNNSYGIYATAGNINLHNGFINLVSPDECYGILGVSTPSDSGTSEPLLIDILSSNIIVGGFYDHDAVTKFTGWNDGATRTKMNGSGQYGASMGIFMANLDTDSHSYISLYGCEVYSVDVGIGARSGDIFITNGGKIESKNSSAIATTGGSIFVGKLKTDYVKEISICGQVKKSIDIDAFSLLNQTSTGGSDLRPSAVETTGVTTTIKSHMGEDGVANGNVSGYNATTNLSYMIKEFTSPNPSLGSVANLQATRHFNVYDCVYINGGNLLAEDKVDISFAGKRNSLQVGANSEYENSFSIHILDGGLVLRKANIINSVGGGVKVSGGNVTLGWGAGHFGTSDNGSLATDVNIHTTGVENGDTTVAGKYFNPVLYHNTSYQGGYPYNWRIAYNYTGGAGLFISNGNLTIYNATIVSENGSGINMLGYGNITIYDGVFTGKIVQEYYLQGGPGSNYGLKVFAGGTINIYNGKFGGANGGAYIMGAANDYTKAVTITKYATVRIYQGQFGIYESDPTTSATGGTDAFTVGEGVNIYLGAYGSGVLSNYTNAILVKGKRTALAVQAINEGTVASGSKSNIYIYYGTYSTTNALFDSIYNGSSNVKGNVHIYSFANPGTTATSNTRFGYWRNPQGETGITYHSGNIWYPSVS